MPQYYAAHPGRPGNSLTLAGDTPQHFRMNSLLRWAAAAAMAAGSVAHAAGDYVGVLRPPGGLSALAIPEPGFYWPSSVGLLDASLATPLAAEGFKLKLGYRYSRYLSVESGYADVMSSPLGSGFSSASSRGRQFRMDTVGTLPLWTHAELYGRFGAWRSTGGASLVAMDGTGRAGAGVRYGLGFKYDVTRRVGLHAEMERFSPIDRWGPRESDTDQVTLGVTWRF